MLKDRRYAPLKVQLDLIATHEDDCPPLEALPRDRGREALVPTGVLVGAALHRGSVGDVRVAQVQREALEEAAHLRPLLRRQ